MGDWMMNVRRVKANGVGTNRAGRSYDSLGAWSYESYREKLAELAEGCADYGLPNWGENEVKYVSPGVEDGARWISLQEGRRPHSVFKVLDASYDARIRVFGNEEPYTRNTL